MADQNGSFLQGASNLKSETGEVIIETGQLKKIRLISGSETSTPSTLDVVSDVSNGVTLTSSNAINLQTAASSAVRVRNSAGSVVWFFDEATGSLNGDGTNGGNIVLAKLNSGLRLKEGAGGRMGVATMVAGTIAVTNANVTANSRIFLSRSTTGGTAGHLSYTISAGVSFTINSSSGTDTSTVNWFIMEPA